MQHSPRMITIPVATSCAQNKNSFVEKSLSLEESDHGYSIDNNQVNNRHSHPMPPKSPQSSKSRTNSHHQRKTKYDSPRACINNGRRKTPIGKRRKRSKHRTKIAVKTHCISTKVRFLLNCSRVKKGRRIRYLVSEYLTTAIPYFAVDIYVETIGQNIRTLALVPKAILKVYWIWATIPRMNDPSLLGEWLVDSTRIQFFAERIENCSIDEEKFMSMVNCYLKSSLSRYARMIQFAYLLYNWKRRKTKPSSITSSDQGDNDGEIVNKGREQKPPLFHYLPIIKQKDILRMRSELIEQVANDTSKHVKALSPFLAHRPQENEEDDLDSTNVNFSDYNKNNTHDIYMLSSVSTTSTGKHSYNKGVQVMSSPTAIYERQIKKIQVVNAYFPRTKVH